MSQKNYENQYNSIIRQISSLHPQLQDIINNLSNDQILQHSFGCLMGAFIGDSLGSFCQFQGPQYNERIQTAMTMPGGGPFHIKPGQLTDDSQMSIHMLKGLMKYQPQHSLSQQLSFLQYSISQEYVKWLKSEPFDIGITCYNALSILQKNIQMNQISLNEYKQKQSFYEKRLQNSLDSINKSSNYSLSNGFLMRIWPMAIFHSLVTKYNSTKENQLRILIANQVKLTHGNQIVIDSAIEWVQMLSQIIKSKKNSDNLKEGQSIKLQLENYNQIFRKFLSQNNYEGSIKNQILKQIQNKVPINAIQSIGYFKHAYHFSIYQILYLQKMHNIYKKQTPTNLFNPQQFKKSLSFVIKQGGDTDTNACIIGGFLGSIFGIRRLPKQYLNKQLKLRFDSNYRRGVGKVYEPVNGFVTLLKLIKKIKK